MNPNIQSTFEAVMEQLPVTQKEWRAQGSDRFVAEMPSIRAARSRIGHMPDPWGRRIRNVLLPAKGRLVTTIQVAGVPVQLEIVTHAN